MKVLREVAQFQLNEGEGASKGLYNITNSILIECTKTEGVSYWFDKGKKDKYMSMSSAEFVTQAKQSAGNTIDTFEIAVKLWEILGDIPINQEEEIEEDFCVGSFVLFPTGIDRETIWMWFEHSYKISVTELMFAKKYNLSTIITDRCNKLDF